MLRLVSPRNTTAVRKWRGRNGAKVFVGGKKDDATTFRVEDFAERLTQGSDERTQTVATAGLSCVTPLGYSTIPPEVPVTILEVSGQIKMQTPQTTTREVTPGARSCVAFTLIELLCVIAIIGILMALLLPVILRAYNKVRGMSEEMEVPGIIASVAHKTRSYCTTHTQYLFLSRSELIDKVGFAPKAHDWVGASTTEFVPFGYLDDTNKIVLTFHFGRKHATVEYLTKGAVTIIPQE